jgi:hypothetical protein
MGNSMNSEKRCKAYIYIYINVKWINQNTKPKCITCSVSQDIG